MEPCEATKLTPGGHLWICQRDDHPDEPILHYWAKAPRDTPKHPPSRELESSLEAFFRKRVQLVGGKALKLAPIEAGTPDRGVLMPGGHFFFVELKQDDGQVSPIQHVWHKRAADIGFDVHVLYGRSGVVAWLRLVVCALSAENTEAEPPA